MRRRCPRNRRTEPTKDALWRQEDILLDDILLDKGRYRARIARTADDLAACHALRSAAFREGAPDGDAFDARCTHVMVQDARTGTLVCCFRLMTLPSGSDIAQSYAAQYYTLDALEGFAGPMVEMGRFCIADGARDPDILRVAWAAMTKLVDAAGVELLFGCSSFQGTEGRCLQ